MKTSSRAKRAGRLVNEQLNGVVNAIVEDMKYQHQKEVVDQERARVRKELRQMFADTNLKTIYKNFYTRIDRPKMFKQGAKGALEYADVFPEPTSANAPLLASCNQST